MACDMVVVVVGGGGGGYVAHSDSRNTSVRNESHEVDGPGISNVVNNTHTL